MSPWADKTFVDANMLGKMQYDSRLTQQDWQCITEG
jgi:hypothetical protein